MRTIHRERKRERETCTPLFIPFFCWWRHWKIRVRVMGTNTTKRERGKGYTRKALPNRAQLMSWFRLLSHSMISQQTYLSSLFVLLFAFPCALIDIKKYILLRYFVSLMSGTWRFYEAPPIYRHQHKKKGKKSKNKSEKEIVIYVCVRRGDAT